MPTVTSSVISVIDRRSDRAIHRQLADILRDQISNGTLRPGDHLPSELRLSQEHGIARSTARQSIAILRGEGLVTVDTRRGYIVRALAQDNPPVALLPGDEINARMPSPKERREYGLDEGVPLLIVTRANGAIRSYPGGQTLRVHPA